MKSDEREGDDVEQETSKEERNQEENGNRLSERKETNIVLVRMNRLENRQLVHTPEPREVLVVPHDVQILGESDETAQRLDTGHLQRGAKRRVRNA